MATPLAVVPAVRVRHAAWDGLLVLCAFAHTAALAWVPSMAVVGLGMWWNANTISHNFIHRPFFRSRWANRLFSLHLTLLLGIPQAFWRERHLRHHGGRTERPRFMTTVTVEAACLIVSWAVLARLAPHWMLTVYVPGYAIGLTLCFLQGHDEHAGGTTSHYGWVYNALFFNDGYHVEHHRRTALHWTDLPLEAEPSTRASRWPAVLRWLDGLTLERLERLVLRSPLLQRFVLDRHEQAFRRLLRRLDDVQHVAIVGGGLFPRSALVLARLLPAARIRIIDRNAANLETARERLRGSSIEFVHAEFDELDASPADLLVVPLDFHGHRDRLYRWPPAKAVIIHDWIWSASPKFPTAIVSCFLLKRLNLVRR